MWHDRHQKRESNRIARIYPVTFQNATSSTSNHSEDLLHVFKCYYTNNHNNNNNNTNNNRLYSNRRQTATKYITTADMQDSATYTSTGMQAKYNQQQGLARANKLCNTSGAKRLQTTVPGLHPVSIHQMAPTERGSTHLITAYYSVIDLERMKG